MHTSIQAIFVLSTIMQTFRNRVFGQIPYGFMVDPPARGAIWRFGFPAIVNYNDNALGCGGFEVLQRTGRCGVCGDSVEGPLEHEAGGVYASGTIVKSYPIGTSTIPITIETMEYKPGYFEFRLCPHNDPTTVVSQTCLDNHLLKLKEGTIESQGTQFRIPYHQSHVYTINARVPEGISCSQCVLQWKYSSGSREQVEDGETGPWGLKSTSLPWKNDLDSRIHACHVMRVLYLEIASSASCVQDSDCKSLDDCKLTSHHWECRVHHCFCRSGTSDLTSSDGKYTFHFTQKSFRGAELDCRAHGQQLVKIDSAEKYKEVKDFGFKSIKHAHPGGNMMDGVWIGLKRDDTQTQGFTFRYTDGAAASYFEWETGEPNRFDLEHCIRVDVAHFLMRTTDCGSSHEYICEHVSNTNVTVPPVERCIEKEDCAKQCRSSEYHCIEYGCHCGEFQ